MENNKVIEHITTGWDDCVKEICEDKGNLIGMPYPYTVPRLDIMMKFIIGMRTLLTLVLP